MTNEYTETVARVSSSITRLQDRLSTPRGESDRQEYAHIFARCIAGQLDDQDGLYLTLPFQVSLLTDPFLFIVAGGLLVLDHPTKPEQFDYAISNHAHIVDLNCNHSLYEGRYPRMIAIAKKHEMIDASWMLNRLMQLNFRGPFAKEIV
jgi:hypothetical protein